MQELFDKWAEIQQRPSGGWPTTVGNVRQKTYEELRVLEALEAVGCSQIPGEAFNVAFMIEDRYRQMREMEERLSS